MNDNVRPAITIGEGISSGVRNLISERARWVQTWIVSRALPFISLLLMVVSYYQIATAAVVMPRSVILFVLALLLSIVVIRALPALRKRQWHLVFGNYQACMAYLALLLLLGRPDSGHSLVFWSFVVLGFWAMGLAYPRQWFIPGEFAAVAVMVAGLSIGAQPPLADWLYASIVFVPIIIWLQWKHDHLKAVLLLSALVLGIWLQATIEGWETILAISGALALLCFAVCAIGKLSRSDASSLIQSVGLAVISGLLWFVFVSLGEFEESEAETWWIMYLVFAAILLFIRWRNGQALNPLLLLWAVHWGVVTLLTTWADWLDPLVTIDTKDWAFLSLPVAGACVLIHAGLKLDNNRLLIWSRLYLAIATVSLYLVVLDEDAVSLPRLLFIGGLFMVMLWFAGFIRLQRGAPWWKGVTSPRHVVALRRIFRKSGSFIASIPFIGAVLSSVIQSLLVISRLKHRSSFHTGDLMLIVLIPLLAIVISRYLPVFVIDPPLAALLLMEPATELMSDPVCDGDCITEGISVMAQTSTFILAGILFGIVGISQREPLYPMLAMVGFLIAPFTLVSGDYLYTGFFWLICLTAAIGVLSVRSIAPEKVPRSLQRGANVRHQVG